MAFGGIPVTSAPGLTALHAALEHSSLAEVGELIQFVLEQLEALLIGLDEGISAAGFFGFHGTLILAPLSLFLR